MRKNKAKKIMLTCNICDTSFEKLSGEYKRQTNKNPDRLWYCSLSCAGTKNKNSLGKYLAVGNPKSLVPNNRRTNLTEFKWFMRVVRQRSKAFNIDEAYLRALWEGQDGKCPLTGWDLTLPKHSCDWHSDDNKYIRASLDRIDSSKGYIKDNVRFIAVIANYCKNSFSDDEVKLFCKAVVENNNLEK